jgi:hypothetical protein
VELTEFQKRKRKKENNERNQVEGKFGQGEQGYGLNNIKAELSNTSQSWIGAIIFISNLVKLAEIYDFKFCLSKDTLIISISNKFNLLKLKS